MILGLSWRRKQAPRKRLEIDTDNTIVYAIGDVHGCYDELFALEAKIVADAEQFDARKLIILLGDYVDRGKDTRRVLDHLLGAPPAGFERICLAGNHDVAMFDYIEGRLGRERWLAYGGDETLFSYGLDAAHLAHLYDFAGVDRFIRANIPTEHVEFLRDLPIMAYSPKFVFVHAGVRSGVGLEQQSESDLMNIRDDEDAVPRPGDRIVIHGHTRVGHPRRNGQVVGLETGAYETGRLTALRIVGTQGRLIFSGPVSEA
jgi:serine/threonine protein phosphatase 1